MPSGSSTPPNSSSTTARSSVLDEVLDRDRQIADLHLLADPRRPLGLVLPGDPQQLHDAGGEDHQAAGDGEQQQGAGPHRAQDTGAVPSVRGLVARLRGPAALLVSAAGSQRRRTTAPRRDHRPPRAATTGAAAASAAGVLRADRRRRHAST